MEPHILYRDPHLLIVRKPSGIPSQPDPTGQPDLLTALRESHPTAALIHRLDTPTGGIMVFGLSQKATSKLCALVQDHNQFRKEYLAVLSSSPQEKKGILKDNLYHDKQKNKAYVTETARKGSKEAVLDYQVLASAPDGHTLVLVRLHTGRTHQIRVQFATRGLPLVGDGKYGSREKAPNISLWAFRLTFPHPMTGPPLSAETRPDPETFPWSLFATVLDSKPTQ